ncbi:hypothetical protein D9M72_471660 [compost metagenome]
MSSQAPVLVPPVQAITPAGSSPAALSLRMAASSALTSIARRDPLAGMRTRFSSPMPETQIARSIEV